MNTEVILLNDKTENQALTFGFINDQAWSLNPNDNWQISQLDLPLRIY